MRWPLCFSTKVRMSLTGEGVTAAPVPMNSILPSKRLVSCKRAALAPPAQHRLCVSYLVYDKRHSFAKWSRTYPLDCSVTLGQYAFKLGQQLLLRKSAQVGRSKAAAGH